jgi:hypothetical protein
VLVTLFVLQLAAANPGATGTPTPVSTPPAAEAAKPKKKKKPQRICYDETPTGSMIAKQRCVTVEQSENERTGAESFTQYTADHDLKTAR